MCCQHPLRDDLLVLEMLDINGQRDFIQTMADQTGGYFHAPEQHNNWDSQRVEIRAHGVFAEGGDDAEAIRNWRRAAHNQMRGIEARQGRVA